MLSITSVIILLWIAAVVLPWLIRIAKEAYTEYRGMITSDGVVAIIRLSGVIMEGNVSSPFDSSLINWKNYERAFETAFQTPGLKSVCLEINSPGGSPVQSSLMVKRIRELRR